mgnify:CR=1 FL=1
MPIETATTIIFLEYKYWTSFKSDLHEIEDKTGRQ